MPVNDYKIAVKRCDEDTEFALVHNFNSKSKISQDFTALQYVACIYKIEGWIGIILEVDKEKGDARTNFMHPHGPSRSFHWPRVDDICWVPITHLLCAIDAPTTITGRQAV